MGEDKSLSYLTGIAMGLVIFALIVAVGVIVIKEMGDMVVVCADPTTAGAIVDENVEGLNSSGQTLYGSTYNNWTALTLTAMCNSTDVIPVANGTVSAITGLLTNATLESWNDNITVNYTFTWYDNHTWNETQGYCVNLTNEDTEAGTGTIYGHMSSLNTELGTTGLVGWVPAVIAVIIGAFFIAFLSGGFGGRRKY